MPLRFMNVSGLASTTSLPEIRVVAVSARQRRLFTVTPPCSASRSMARKPALWGVNWYSMPGFPRPTTRAGPFLSPSTSSAKLRARSLLSALFRSRVRSLGLALLGHFRLRWSCCRHRVHRRRHFFLDRHHVGYGCVLIGNELELATTRQVGYADGAIQCQATHVHVNMAGNITRQALDFNLAQHLVENATL